MQHSPAIDTEPERSPTQRDPQAAGTPWLRSCSSKAERLLIQGGDPEMTGSPMDCGAKAGAATDFPEACCRQTIPSGTYLRALRQRPIRWQAGLTSAPTSGQPQTQHRLQHSLLIWACSSKIQPPLPYFDYISIWLSGEKPLFPDCRPLDNSRTIPKAKIGSIPFRWLPAP